MTEYVILRAEEDETLANPGSRWREVKPNVKASSASRALAYADVKAGTYVAIPVRSWKPLTVKVEQTTKVTIS